jgi:mannosyltransferase OCH1-like enzyme
VVPRILHQIWLGRDPLPEEFVVYQESWLRHHPRWELVVWTEENLPDDLRRAEIYERLRVPAERADLLRLEVLYRHGGVYVDTDFECVRSLEPVIKDFEFFTANKWSKRVNNAFLGATPEHHILDRAIGEARPREFYGYDKWAAGPEFLDRIVSEYPEVKIFGPELFYPRTPRECRKAVAIHHQARSWKNDDEFKKAALRAEQRLAETLARLEDLEERYVAVCRQVQALGGDPPADFEGLDAAKSPATQPLEAGTAASG